MHLIVGATGALGGLIANGLLELGEPVRALVRESSDHGPLQKAGADLAFGDLKDPASLEAACQGATRIVATATAASRGGEDTVESVDRSGYGALISAAEAAGVGQFVFVSAHGFEADSPVALARAKATTEEALRASSLDYTILRPALFMEAWIGWILGGQLEQGPKVAVIGSADRPYGFVATPNVADLAIASLGHPDVSRATVPLSAAAASFRQLVDWIGEETGQSIEIQEMEPGTELPFLPPVVTELWNWAARGGMDNLVTPEAADKFGIQMVSPRAWVARAFGAG